jgi:hypothetical protein
MTSNVITDNFWLVRQHGGASGLAAQIFHGGTSPELLAETTIT